MQPDYHPRLRVVLPRDASCEPGHSPSFTLDHRLGSRMATIASIREPGSLNS